MTEVAPAIRRRGESRPAVPPKVLVSVLALVGLVLRIWMIQSPVGRIDSDDAIVGLMARHFSHGEFVAYYWGQAYGGSIEPLLASAFFTVLGVTPFALKLATVAWSALAAYLVYLVGRPLVGEAAARVGAVLFWIAPAAFLYWSTRAGSYWASLCLGLLAVLVLVRSPSEERWPPWLVAGFGALVGLCWWANPQTGYLVLPAGLLSWRRLARQWRLAPLGLLGAVVGALPGLAWNLRHEWGSLALPPGQPGIGYVDHLRSFFELVLPSALGLKAAFSGPWVPAGRLVYLAVLVAFVVGVARRRRGKGVLFAVACAYPFLYALSPATWYTGHPRYALFLWPVAALLVAALAAPRRTVAVALLAAVVVVSTAQARDLETRGVTDAAAYGVAIPDHFGDLKSLLAAERVRYAFSDYWIAYRATFEMDERAIITPFVNVRYGPYDREVRASSAPAYVLLTRSPAYGRFQRAAADRGISLRMVERGDFAVIFPGRKVLPEELGLEWLFG